MKTLDKIISLLEKILLALSIDTEYSDVLYKYEYETIINGTNSRTVESIKIKPINGEKETVHGFLQLFDKLGITYLDVLEDETNSSMILGNDSIIYDGTNRTIFIYIKYHKDLLSNKQRFDKDINNSLRDLLKALEPIKGMDEKAIRLLSKI